jgi:transposase-like protein
MSSKRKTKQKSTPPQTYSEAFKRQVVMELEQGLSTKATLRRKYGIAGHSCIPRWCRQYGKLLYLSHTTTGRPMNDPKQQRIKELEAQLKEKELELNAYRDFIKIAERELQIKIVKKSGTRQSKK